jgi:hypothetical protein
MSHRKYEIEDAPFVRRLKDVLQMRSMKDLDEENQSKCIPPDEVMI